MTVWTVLWIVWILGFFAIEVPAILNDKREDTLSEHFRRWFSTKSHRGRSVWIIVSGVFFAWFVVHIAVAGAA